MHNEIFAMNKVVSYGICYLSLLLPRGRNLVVQIVHGSDVVIQSSLSKPGSFHRLENAQMRAAETQARQRCW